MKKKFANLTDKLKIWAEIARNSAMAVLVLGTIIISATALIKLSKDKTIFMEPVRVPEVFEKHGFSPDVFANQLLDEVFSLERQSISIKDRVAFKNNYKDAEVEKQGPVAGVNVKSVQSAVKDILGIKGKSISGEVTAIGPDSHPSYKIRLRRLPENNVFVDLTANGDPESIIKQTALAMLEEMDPHIAASIYWYNGDEENALRLIDIALTKLSAAERKYPLNLRARIHIAKGRFKEANADLEAIKRIDPNHAFFHVSQAYLYREMGHFNESLSEADKSMELAPEKWWGAHQKALTLEAMGRSNEAEAMYKKALDLKADWPPVFVSYAHFLEKKNDLSAAKSVLRNGLALFPKDHKLILANEEFVKKTNNRSTSSVDSSKK